MRQKKCETIRHSIYICKINKKQKQQKKLEFSKYYLTFQSPIIKIMEQIIHVADNTTIIKQNTSIAKKKRKSQLVQKRMLKILLISSQWKKKWKETYLIKV